MIAELLLEIGTEEIPSNYLEQGLGELKRLAEAYLEKNRIKTEGGLFVYGTPMRLVLIGKGISKTQADLVQEVTGPPKNVAYDEDGRPTKAALGFAQKQGVSIKDLEFTVTPRGEYLSIRRRIAGRPTGEVLTDALPKLIADIPWPKSMRWGRVDFPFVRPIQWVLAIFDGKTIPFEVAGVTSNNTTRGHRFMAPDEIEISNVQDYTEKLKGSFVLIDQQERESVVKKVAGEAARTVGGVPIQDPELVTTVANLVEYPSAVCGSFDQAFLALPVPVLITAMKEHQRYFAVYDSKGRLMPNFVGVNNTNARDETVVRRGHERVLRARLSDADFFFREDLKRPLEDRIEALKHVIYQADLGTSYAKVQRFTRLAEFLAKTVAPSRIDDVRLVAGLCKCDLVTHMIKEFPSLQGVMGEEYASREGYDEEICLAIHEHYLPIRAGGQLPTSLIGALVGLADRMDTIAGCFAVGLLPSGSADPFALRRHALAIIRVLEEMQWGLSLEAFIGKALDILGEDIEFDGGLVFSAVTGFFRERYKQMALRLGYESELVESVISVGFDRIDQLQPRLGQLRKFASESEEFQAVVLTSKRVKNILKNQERPFGVDPGLFNESCESTLWMAFKALKDDIERCLENGEYYRSAMLMAGLRKPVDEFFEGVEVLTRDDMTLRQNRVGLLQHISRLFLCVADFSVFSI